MSIGKCHYDVRYCENQSSSYSRWRIVVKCFLIQRQFSTFILLGSFIRLAFSNKTSRFDLQIRLKSSFYNYLTPFD